MQRKINFTNGFSLGIKTKIQGRSHVPQNTTHTHTQTQNTLECLGDFSVFFLFVCLFCRPICFLKRDREKGCRIGWLVLKTWRSWESVKYDQNTLPLMFALKVKKNTKTIPKSKP